MALAGGTGGPTLNTVTLVCLHGAVGEVWGAGGGWRRLHAGAGGPCCTPFTPCCCRTSVRRSPRLMVPAAPRTLASTPVSLTWTLAPHVRAGGFLWGGSRVVLGG